MKGISYLAIPYSHPDEEVREYRFRIANKITAKLMNEGEIVFSPISHGHSIVKEHKLPTSWDYWGENCTEFISKCSRMYVIKVDGWEESTGVQAEIELAKQMEIPITYLDVTRY